MGRKFEPCWDRHMKPESKLWQLVKKNIPSIHWTRLESWAMPGVPDVYGIQDGISVFVELKVTRSNKIGLSAFQKKLAIQPLFARRKKFYYASAPRTEDTLHISKFHSPFSTDTHLGPPLKGRASRIPSSVGSCC